MVRKLVVVFTSVVLFAAAHVKALGLGEIVIESSLNQPFNAQIAFLKLGDVRPEQIQIQMASERDFARFSIDRENFLNTIEFDIQSQGDESYVRLTTDEVVREPYLSFVLETRWPNGRLLNEYTVLLDLPAFAGNGSATAIQQAVQADSAPQQSIQNQIPAAASSSAVSQSPARLAAPADEPEAVAAPAAVEETAAPEVAAEPAPEPVVEPEPEVEPSVARNANTSETVTIDSSDTLWDVALQVRPDSTVSVQQTMLALQSLNREAFIGDNINMVRRGQVLRVPTLEQIRALSAREAMSEVSRQNQLFDNRRNVPLASQPITAQPQGATGAAPSRGELSVVSVDNAEPANAQAANDSQNAELDARIASLEDALAVQREESDRAALVNEELVARLGLLEEQIASAQEIIRLRDLELAQLQDALAQAEEAAVEAPAEEPTVITMAPEKSLVERILDTLVANTFALVALIGLLILMLVFVLLRRNRAAEQAALADIDAMPVAADEETSEEDDSESVSDDSSLHADIDDDNDEMDELFNIADDADDEATDSEIDEDDGYEINDTEEVLFEDEPGTETAIDDTPELTTPPVADDVEVTKDIIEEVDALIAYEKIDEAEVALRDAIVAQPDRADLRMKMLEVLVAKQDAIGFKLQETEIRDMDVRGLEPRIATLRSQLDSELDSEILEEGEDDFFNELNELDDMEVALDLEASAEVDDSKVLSGQVDAEERDEDDIELGDESTGDAASDDIDFDLSVEEKAQLADDFAKDALEDDDISLDLEVDDADKDENDIDFDFVIEEPEIPNDAVKEPEPVVEAQSAEDSGNEIDFDFDLSDELSDADSDVEILDETTELPNTHASDEKAKDFDLSVEDDVEIEFLDDDEDEEHDNIAFDDASFDLSIDEKPSAEKQAPAVEAEKGAVDDFDDLQFVDDSLEDNAEEDDEELEDDLDFLSDADEAATKLDLARAYFEMGDVDGAREILEEVVNEGNEEQVADAKALIEKL